MSATMCSQNFCCKRQGNLKHFIIQKQISNQTEKLTPMIEAKYDEIYEICEKGNKLLY